MENLSLGEQYMGIADSECPQAVPHRPRIAVFLRRVKNSWAKRNYLAMGVQWQDGSGKKYSFSGGFRFSAEREGELDVILGGPGEDEQIITLPGYSDPHDTSTNKDPFYLYEGSAVAIADFESMEEALIHAKGTP